MEVPRFTRPCRSCKRDGLSSSIMRCRLRHASQPSYLGLLNSETLKCTSSRSRSLDQCLPSPPSPPKSKLQVRKAPVSNPEALKHKSIAVVSSSPSSSWRSFCSSSSSSAWWPSTSGPLRTRRCTCCSCDGSTETMVKRLVPRGQTDSFRSSSPCFFGSNLWFWDYYCFGAILRRLSWAAFVTTEKLLNSHPAMEAQRTSCKIQPKQASERKLKPLTPCGISDLGKRKPPALLRAALVNSIATDDRRSLGDVELL